VHDGLEVSLTRFSSAADAIDPTLSVNVIKELVQILL